MATVKAFAKKLASGEATIYCRYTHNEEHCLFSVLRIDDHSRFVNGRIKERKSDPPAVKNKLKQDNEILASKMADIQSLANDLMKTGIDPNIDQVRALYNEKKTKTKEKSVTFNDRVEQFLDSGKRTIETRRQIKSIFKRLDVYLKSKKVKPGYHVFTKEFYDKYTSHLRKGTKDRQKLGENSISNHIKFIKAFLIWSKDEGYFEPNFPLKKYKSSMKPKTNVSLTAVEISKFYSFEFKASHLERARDRFILHCTLGLRVSDFKRFIENPRMYVVGNFVIMTQQKTKGRTGIPLTSLGREILDKYDWQLPKLSDQKYNLYLKISAEQAGIDNPVEIEKILNGKGVFVCMPKFELLSTHCARKTFATSTHSAGISVKKISLMMGISVPTLIRHYIGDDLSGLVEDMENVNAFIAPAQMKVS